MTHDDMTEREQILVAQSRARGFAILAALPHAQTKITLFYQKASASWSHQVRMMMRIDEVESHQEIDRAQLAKFLDL